jgi:hypothetical protein
MQAVPGMNESLKPQDFPVKFSVSREFDTENGSLETPSTAIAWSSRSRDARTGLVANLEDGLHLSPPTVTEYIRSF